MISFVTCLTDQHLRIITRFPAGLALFAFRALPASTLAGSQSSVQTGSMIVMPTASAEEEVIELPRPLTHCTASLLQMCSPLTVVWAEQPQGFHG